MAMALNLVCEVALSFKPSPTSQAFLGEVDRGIYVWHILKTYYFLADRSQGLFTPEWLRLRLLFGYDVVEETYQMG